MWWIKLTTDGLSLELMFAIYKSETGTDGIGLQR